MTVGLPRSGKSTWAIKWKFPIVNPDSIRLALHGNAFIKDAEPIVWVIAKYMVKALFIAGHNKVILDATNMTNEARDYWEDEMWKRSYVYFDATKEQCVDRARNADRLYLIDVINRMDEEKELDYKNDA